MKVSSITYLWCSMCQNFKVLYLFEPPEILQIATFVNTVHPRLGTTCLFANRSGIRRGYYNLNKNVAQKLDECRRTEKYGRRIDE